MPVYDYECKKCKKNYEHFLTVENYLKKTKCPDCKSVGKKIVLFKKNEPSFSDKVFPYYDESAGQRFENNSERKKYLSDNGLVENGKGSMTKKQEERLYRSRGRGNNNGFAYEDL